MATLIGLVIGSLILCANFQFGLQTGWVSMMSMPAALLGFAWYKAIRRPLNPQEHVYIQSVAVAVGSGPLSFGFVGAIPAIEKLITRSEGQMILSVSHLLVWSFGCAFLGIFTAMLLRKTIVLVQKLKFPSGIATASLIGVLHAKPVPAIDCSHQLERRPEDSQPEDPVEYKRSIKTMTSMFGISAGVSLLSWFVPILKALPIFGLTAAGWNWKLDISPAYVGQGIIMGLPTTVSMLIGSIMGWALLGPLSKAKGWAPGDVDSWTDGAQGWIMWVAIAIMVADTFVSLGEMIIRMIREAVQAQHRTTGDFEELTRLSEYVDNEPASTPSSAVDFQTPAADTPAEDVESDPNERKIALVGLVAASTICVLLNKLVFQSQHITTLILAVVIAPFFSLLAVRALGDTDLNPVSSIAKLSQLLFGLLFRHHKYAVLGNILAGAVSEAGAQQAGELMQEFKTGWLLGASASAQTIGITIGTLWSIVLSPLVYKLYSSAYSIPGKEFRVPASFIWTDCARLVVGKGLPDHAASFAAGLGLISFCLALLKLKVKSPWIPSGVTIGIGMYNVPSFTLARFVGGLIFHFSGGDDIKESPHLVILSSGLVLGESIISVLSLVSTVIKK